MDKQSEDYVTIRQASEILGLSYVRVREFCLEGRLGFRVGSYWIIPRKELFEFAKQRRTPGRPRTSELGYSDLQETHQETHQEMQP